MLLLDGNTGYKNYAGAYQFSVQAHFVFRLLPVRASIILGGLRPARLSFKPLASAIYSNMAPGFVAYPCLGLFYLSRMLWPNTARRSRRQCMYGTLACILHSRGALLSLTGNVLYSMPRDMLSTSSIVSSSQGLLYLAVKSGNWDFKGDLRSSLRKQI